MNRNYFKTRGVLTLVLIALLMISTAASAAPKLDKKLIDAAKEGLLLMSYQEYKSAVKTLPFSSGAPSAAKLKTFATEDLSDLAYVTVQSATGVAYVINNSWRIAIPIEDPTYESVQVFVLRSKDGSGFDAMKAMTWYEVMDEIDQSDNVIWQDAYAEGSIYFVADSE